MKQALQNEREEWFQNFAGFLRHELNNQLVGMQGSLDLLARAPERGDKYLSRANASLDSMRAMVNEAADATSIDSALEVGASEHCNLSALVSECVAAYGDAYPDVTFEVRVEGDVHLHCQPFRIVQLLDKLVANIKAGDQTTANIEKWDPSSWPAEAKGVGVAEAPRGALGHWVKIKNGRIDNYQCVVPTTWNGSPRDNQGNIGAFEASLLNTPMERPDEPVEILRTLHSFDPCLACSTHVMSPDGDELTTVKVR